MRRRYKRPMEEITGVPAWRDGAAEMFALHGTDRQIAGSRHLFFAGNAALLPTDAPGIATLRGGEWLGGGSFRNSFFLAPWRQLAAVRDLRLVVQASGDLRVRVACARPGRPADTLAEMRHCSPQRVSLMLPLPPLTDLANDARLFWHVDAHAPSALHDVAFATRSKPLRPSRLAVLIRTHGRSADVQAMLSRFAAAGRSQPRAAAALDRIDFWLLQTAEGGGTRQFAADAFAGLNLRIFEAPNLGGGGNASLLAKLFLDHARSQARGPDEVLILDDDLSISFESIARYLAFCSFREKEAVMSLPLLMQSRPTTVWEDGGLWGRLAADGSADRERSRTLFPTLLKHGTSLEGYDRLDDFGALNTAEYATFVFWGAPRATLERIGLPAAFFLRGDDIELSLRARAAGVPLVTNPNLAAWHEPGHSHAHEYMAILHAVLINLRYAADDAASHARFFEERLYEHAAIGDVAGLSVYLQVLLTLIDTTSLVLTPGFAAHYADVLPRLNAAVPPAQRLSATEREKLEKRSRDAGKRVLPFLHAGYHRPAAGPVLLMNPSRSEAHEIGPTPFAAKAELMRRYIRALATFEAQFDALRTHWSARLQASGTEAFWTGVQAEQAPLTRSLATFRREPVVRDAIAIGQALTPVGAAPPDAGPLPLTELRDRLEHEWRALARLRTEIGGGSTDLITETAATQPPAPQRDGLWQRWISRTFGRGDRADKPVAAPALPPDFVAEDYLALNADVAHAGFDAANHYLRFGHREGRRYLRPGSASLEPTYRKE
jgi:GT2 family glycosyltransferase